MQRLAVDDITSRPRRKHYTHSRQLSLVISPPMHEILSFECLQLRDPSFQVITVVLRSLALRFAI